jgi:hypothetical protein
MLYLAAFAQAGSAAARRRSPSRPHPELVRARRVGQTVAEKLAKAQTAGNRYRDPATAKAAHDGVIAGVGRSA